MNLKTTLIDHLNNEYRYMKYQITERSSKLKQSQELLCRLKSQIEKHVTQQNMITQEVDETYIINAHNRQCIELTSLSNEYERLQHENHLLTLKAKENLQRLSLIMQSNHHYILEKSH